MTHLRFILLLLTASLVLGACSKDEETFSSPPGAGAIDLLAYVPADTPYLLANLDPIPEDILDSYLEKVQPVLDAMQQHLSQVRADLEASGSGNTSDPANDVAQSLLSELDGKLNRVGMESMGFDLRAHKVIYGHGAFPVIRLGLSDATLLRATILRVMENAGVTAPERDFQGVRYWRVSDDDPEEVPVGMYIAILEDHLAISLWPLTTEAERLPAFLGLEKPADSTARQRLARLNKTHGYTAYGSGILDTHRFIDEVMQHASLSPVCVSEILQMADNAPMMTMGVQELTATAVAMQYRVETPNALAKQLMGLVSEIPVAKALSERALEFALGLKFGPLRDFLLEKATAIVTAPYECEHLAELNLNARNAQQKLTEAMPPFLNNFRGVRVSLDKFNPGLQSAPEEARGVMALHVEQPQMLVGMAQMFVPDLSELAITPGDPPVQLPQSMMPEPGIVAHAAMSATAIGIALGAGEEESLPEFLEEKSGPEGMFLSASYDMRAYLEYTDMLTDSVKTAYDVDIKDEMDDRSHRSQHTDEIRQAAADAFRKIADRSTSSVSFKKDGVVIESRVTFK